jgi:cyclopropane fatty-acyl-phospholipid synthase-like methyltransferase
MDALKFTTVAHRHHRFCNPLDPAVLDRVLDGLGLTPGDRVLDLGCGKGALLVDLAVRYGVTAVGVDINAAFLAEGRAFAERCGVPGAVSLVETEASRFESTPGSFALGACIGSSHALGGYAGTLQELARRVRPGGHVLAGHGYWKREPDREYLERLGATADELTDHEGNITAGLAPGLVGTGAWTSTDQDWARYEDLYADTVERHAAEHPEDPDAPAMLVRIRRWRETYLRWGRDTLGFGLYLFRRS